MGYTLEQLQQMGAKPVVNTASLEPKKYTLEELQGLGAKPVENVAPVESNKYGITGKYISNLGSQYKDTADYLMNLPNELKAPSINASESFLPQLGGAALTAGRQVAKGVAKGVGAVFAPVTALSQTALPETEQEKITGETGFLRDVERGVISGLPFGPGGAITGGILSGGFNVLNKKINELELKYPETFKANPSLKEDINNVATTLLSISPGLLPAGKSVPGTDMLNTNVSNYPKALVESYKPVTDVIGAGIKKITPKPEEIMNRVARLSPNEAKQFKNIAKESHGEYLKKTGNFGTPKEIVEREAIKFSKSIQETDNALEQLKGNYKSPYIDMVVDDLVKRELEIGVPNSESLKINNLFQKNSKEGLTMKEINEAKRIYERNVKLGYYKEQNTIGIARATRLDSALRDWQFKKARELGLKNLDKLNKQTQISKFIVNKLGGKIDSRTGNNAITLTDWIVLSNGNPSSIGAFLAKKFITSKGIQSKFAKMLSGTPESDVKADYQKPTPLMELPAGRQIDLPESGVLRGQQNLRTIPQTNPIEQPLQELLPKQLRKTSSINGLPKKR